MSLKKSDTSSLPSYSAVKKLLNTLEFYKFYQTQISKTLYTVNYGSKAAKNLETDAHPVKEIDFISTANSIPKGKYHSAGKRIVDDTVFGGNQSLGNSISGMSETDLLLSCIKIFDWGNVQDSNIEKAFSMHDENMLTSHLQNSIAWLNNDNEITLPGTQLIWSAGWTKVYSFASNFVTIYDSRCAAFLNYILIKFYCTLPEKNQPSFKELTSKMLFFAGKNTNIRVPNKATKKILGLKTYSAGKNDARAMVANKYASWVIRYITEVHFKNEIITQEQFRTVDKAFFMLGFNIDDIATDSELEKWYKEVKPATDSGKTKNSASLPLKAA
ncbi:hypothetical protein [Rugamonas rivuli]|uniref:Uncharacterized protein n=1 Tax=Rugamonas rivuli TaxID=2743358 RepID=A0A843SBA5_9BURK|nr:hypothetical protein [Rugamonas rivuli]MQA21775.1 hypothetical protein [Rugamonas rivuli]